jgi:hypothetical protein
MSLCTDKGKNSTVVNQIPKCATEFRTIITNYGQTVPTKGEWLIIDSRIQEIMEAFVEVRNKGINIIIEFR